MIDYNNALKQFNSYLQDYDLSDDMIKLKIKHTYGVVKLSKFIAQNLNLNENEINLAKLIALLHDIGRFEEVKRYQDFNKEKMDHASLAIKILFDDNLIRNFIKTQKLDNIIKEAILNHNKLEINKNLNEKEILFAKILRDADKSDNFRVSCEDSFENMFNSSLNKMENSLISLNVYQDFMNNKVINNLDRKTDLDFWVATIALIYDFNFPISLKHLNEKKYLNTMKARLDCKDRKTKKQLNEIFYHAQNYINAKLTVTKY